MADAENNVGDDVLETDESILEDEDDLFNDDKDSFLLPSNKTRFTLRKRKRRVDGKGGDKTDGDSVSLCSLDMEQDQPETKKKKSLSKMSSLSNMLSLSKVSKMGSALHKSLSSSRFGSPIGSMRTPSSASLARSASTVFGDSVNVASGRKSPGAVSLQDNQGPTGWASSPFRKSSVCLSTRKNSTSNLTPYKAPGPTPSKSRPTRYWSEVYSCVLDKLSGQEVKLQEAVFEIFNGEEDLVEDLKLIRKTYADSLIHLNILSPAEENLVFGHMSALLPLHQAFHSNLKRHQCKDGFWFEIGPAVDKWVKTIELPYVNYCSNLIEAKAFLDKKQANDKSFSDFLQRCLESPFSRKLDLWSFLDVPRSRLVKYPLLLKQVLKYSDEEDDMKILTECISKLEKIIDHVDAGMAEAKCARSISTMEFISATPPECVAEARQEVMSGVLRNGRGTKVLVYLLDTALVVGRQVSRAGQGKVTQVYREPIPVVNLLCQDLTDGESSNRPGSFHRAFTNQTTSKNAFRVSNGEVFDAENNDRAITLLAADEHTKKQWMTAIQKAITRAGQFQTDGSAKLGTSRSTPTRSSPRRLNKAQKKMSGHLLNMSARTSSPKLLSASKLLSTPKVKTTSKLASASQLLSPSGRLFKKNPKSPLIKSSLSQTTLEKIQSGGVKKVRSKPRLNDENIYRGAAASCGPAVTQLTSRRSKSAAKVVGQSQTKTSRRMLQLIDENTKNISKSLMQINAENQPSSPRYVTRSTTKLSKSMNDLLQL